MPWKILQVFLDPWIWGTAILIASVLTFIEWRRVKSGKMLMITIQINKLFTYQQPVCGSSHSHKTGCNF